MLFVRNRDPIRWSSSPFSSQRMKLKYPRSIAFSNLQKARADTCFLRLVEGQRSVNVMRSLVLSRIPGKSWYIDVGPFIATKLTHESAWVILRESVENVQILFERGQESYAFYLKNFAHFSAHPQLNMYTRLILHGRASLIQ